MRISNRSRRRLSDALPGGKRRRERDEGQAVVEFALVMPLLLLILFAIIQFGILLNNYITVNDAARAGARQLALEQGNNDPCDPAVSAVTNAASDIHLTVTSNVTVTFASPTGGTPTGDYCVGTIVNSTTTNPAPYTYPAGNTSTSATNAGNENQGDEAIVIVNRTFPLSILGFGITSVHLSASASDAIE